MQGIGFAIVANIQRLWDTLRGSPPRCNRCDKVLIHESKRYSRSRAQVYACPDAPQARVLAALAVFSGDGFTVDEFKVVGYPGNRVVVECDS